VIYILYNIVSKLSCSICHIFTFDRVPLFNATFATTTSNHIMLKTEVYGLHFSCRQYGTRYRQFDVVGCINYCFGYTNTKYDPQFLSVLSIMQNLLQANSYSSLDWVLSHWAHFTVRRFICVCVNFFFFVSYCIVVVSL